MNSDAAFEYLLPYLKPQDEKRVLWLADENLLDSITQLSAWAPSSDSLTLISNRFDVTEEARQNNLDCSFSDFDFSGISDSSVDTVVYRVSKEKPVVNHIINQAKRCLKLNGQLILAGEKSDGCKTYIDKASRMFGRKVPAQKNGNIYVGVIPKFSENSTELLDDKDYPNTRPVFELNEHTLVSKPGLFGWNKEDRGSALLIETTERFIREQNKAPQSLLDLGCGYGYLSLASAQWPSIITRAATDNNAAAVRVCAENASNFELDLEITADDCGSRIQSDFDLILCNPPFHQGFSVDSRLTEKFLNNTHRLLAKDGTALFVVNLFIGLEKKAKTLFGQVDVIANNGQFKVIALRK